jgi:Phosphodiester glycosidase
MVTRKILLWLFMFLLVFSGPTSAAGQADDAAWLLIAPGIEYRQFQLPDPNNVFVVRMDRSNPDVTIDSSIAQGSLTAGRETVSGMFSRYNQAINYWGGAPDSPTWGKRNQVVVAINGSYFDLADGMPQGGQVQSGWYAKPYDKLGGWGGFAWKLDRSAFISECVHNVPKNQLVTYPETGVVQQIDDINDPLNEDEVVIFTPQYQTRTGTPPSVVDVLVEMSSPTLIMPYPGYASGTVRQIRIGEGNSYIPFNYIVLSANGIEAETLLANVRVGSEIRISQDITSYEYDCETAYTLNWTGTYASIQGAFFFLKEGEIREFTDPGAVCRNPRTAIAYNDRYVYFIVVDGRDYYRSMGMSIDELAVFTRDTLDASWGVAQDGGGSSTMVINGRVVNNTYCNMYNCNYYYDYQPPVITGDGMLEQVDFSSEQVDVAGDGSVFISPAGIERAVANGMMMVIVQPPDYSNAFRPGEAVTTRSNTNLRLGPGTNYEGLAVIPGGTPLTIVNQMNSLDGVLAKSTYWWYVDFEGTLGWVPQDELIKQGTIIDYFRRK